MVEWLGIVLIQLKWWGKKTKIYYSKLKTVDSLAPCYTLLSLFWSESVSLSHRHMITQQAYDLMKFTQGLPWKQDAEHFTRKNILQFISHILWVIFYGSNGQSLFIFVVNSKHEFSPFPWSSYCANAYKQCPGCVLLWGEFEGCDIKYMSFFHMYRNFWTIKHTWI